MAKLDCTPNEPTKDETTQFKQIFLALQNIFNWSGNILTQICVNYAETQNAGDVSETNTNYVGLPNYSHTANVKNPVCLLNLNLQLKGTGYIGIVINGLLVTEIPFNNMGYNPVIHSFYYNLNVGKNSIDIRWKANTGTISKANSTTNQGWNSIQVISFNS